MLRQLAHAAVQLMQAHTTLAYEQADTLRLGEWHRGYSEGIDDAATVEELWELGDE